MGLSCGRIQKDESEYFFGGVCIRTRVNSTNEFASFQRPRGISTEIGAILGPDFEFGKRCTQCGILVLWRLLGL